MLTLSCLEPSSRNGMAMAVFVSPDSSFMLSKMSCFHCSIDCVFSSASSSATTEEFIIHACIHNAYTYRQWYMYMQTHIQRKHMHALTEYIHKYRETIKHTHTHIHIHKHAYTYKYTHTHMLADTDTPITPSKFL